MSTLSLFTSSASSHILLFSCGRLTNLHFQQHHIDLLPMNVKSNGNSQLFCMPFYFVVTSFDLKLSNEVKSQIGRCWRRKGGAMCSLKMFKTSLLHFAFTFGTSVVHLSWDTETQMRSAFPRSSDVKSHILWCRW